MSFASRFAYLSKIMVASLSLAILGSAADPGAQAFASSQNYEQVFKDGGSSYVLLFAFPSASYLDWSSPSKLTWTSIQSTLAKRTFALPTTIGHAQFAWHCQEPDGKLLSSGASGHSGERHGQSLQILKNGWGMSLLELVYSDGVLESTQDVKNRIKKGAAKDQFSWVGFKVPTSNCMDMARFVTAFADSGAYKNYGFPVDPLKLEGAGCTSFAHAAVVKAAVPLPFRQDWLRQYNISKAHMGRAKDIPEYTKLVPQAKIPKEKNHVALTDFLFGDQTWAKKGEPSVPFQYYDPELFYESFLHLENAYRAQSKLPLRQATRTSKLDSYQKKIQNATKNWFAELADKKTDMQLDQIQDKTGLIIDLR